VKGALKETLDKAILPFCSYLLKVIQDFQTYSLAFQKNKVLLVD
jgi:hypothetical protein